MERVIDVTSARRKFGTLLDEVFHKGDVVIIERKGKPLAKIIPVGEINYQGNQSSEISPQQRALLDEIREVLYGNLNNLGEIKWHLHYLETLAKQEVLRIVIPNSAVRMKANEIARTGNSQSGYPGITDSLYHALAILNDTVFVTNDKKHIKKVKAYGHIQQLSQYSCSTTN